MKQLTAGKWHIAGGQPPVIFRKGTQHIPLAVVIGTDHGGGTNFYSFKNKITEAQIHKDSRGIINIKIHESTETDLNRRGRTNPTRTIKGLSLR